MPCDENKRHLCKRICAERVLLIHFPHADDPATWDNRFTYWDTASQAQFDLLCNEINAEAPICPLEVEACRECNLLWDPVTPDDLSGCTTLSDAREAIVGHYRP